eukprot:6194965-Amphidinium_carterae.1
MNGGHPEFVHYVLIVAKVAHFPGGRKAGSWMILGYSTKSPPSSITRAVGDGWVACVQGMAIPLRP